MNSVKGQRRRFVHFLSAGTLELLCGGDGDEPSGADVNGISVCAVCARRLTEQVERAPRLEARRAFVRRWNVR